MTLLETAAVIPLDTEVGAKLLLILYICEFNKILPVLKDQ